MKISQVLKESTEKLKNKNIINPFFETELLLAFTLKKSREFLIANPGHLLTSSELNKFNKLLEKRINNYPIAYLIGEKEFYGLDFKINKNVLIPRPETELIVDQVLNIVNKYNKPINIYDIGTGSACVIIAIAKKLHFRKNIKYYAIDISKKALKIAKNNAKLHKVKINFHQGNLLNPLASKINNRNLNIITANLPYLTPIQIKNSPTIQHEPKIALAGGNDGLDCYQQLFQQIKHNKLDNYLLFCEIDESQTSKIKQLIKNQLPQKKFKILKDLSGYNRLFVISGEINL